MTKSSKACSYTGHKSVMNGNITKERFETERAKAQLQQAKSGDFHAGSAGTHHNKVAYPEVQAAQARAEKKCTCKK